MTSWQGGDPLYIIFSNSARETPGPTSVFRSLQMLEAMQLAVCPFCSRFMSAFSESSKPGSGPQWCSPGSMNTVCQLAEVNVWSPHWLPHSNTDPRPIVLLLKKTVGSKKAGELGTSQAQSLAWQARQRVAVAKGCERLCISHLNELSHPRQVWALLSPPFNFHYYWCHIKILSFSLTENSSRVLDYIKCRLSYACLRKIGWRSL